MSNKKIESLTSSQLVPIDVREKDFQKLMNIYEMAMIQVKEDLEGVQNSLNNFYQYDVISNISCRVKTPDSIIKKMKKKQYNLNYKSLIENIDDIAGIRIVCLFKNDIPKVIEIIREDPNLEILEEKDYIKYPKKVGIQDIILLHKHQSILVMLLPMLRQRFKLEQWQWTFGQVQSTRLNIKQNKDFLKQILKKWLDMPKLLINLMIE